MVFDQTRAMSALFFTIVPAFSRSARRISRARLPIRSGSPARINTRCVGSNSNGPKTNGDSPEIGVLYVLYNIICSLDRDTLGKERIRNSRGGMTDGVPLPPISLLWLSRHHRRERPDIRGGTIVNGGGITSGTAVATGGGRMARFDRTVSRGGLIYVPAPPARCRGT